MVAQQLVRIRVIAVAIIMAVVFLTSGIATAPKAQAFNPACLVVPITCVAQPEINRVAGVIATKLAPGLKAISNNVVKIGDKVAASAATAAAKAATAAVKAAANPVAQSLLDFWTAITIQEVKWVMSQVTSMLTSVSDPNTQAAFFLKQYQKLVWLVLLAQGAVGMALVILILLTRRWKLVRRLIFDLPLCTLLGLTAPALVEMMIIGADWMTKAFSSLLSNGSNAYAEALGTSAAITGAGPLGGLAASAGILVWGSCLYLLALIRQEAIYIGTLLALFALLARVFGGRGEWLFNKLVYFLIVLVFAKPLVTLVLASGSLIEINITGDAAAQAMAKSVIGGLTLFLSVAASVGLFFAGGTIRAAVDELAKGDTESEHNTEYVSEPQAQTHQGLISRANDTVSRSPLLPLAATAIAGPEAGAAVKVAQMVRNTDTTSPSPVQESPVRDQPAPTDPAITRSTSPNSNRALHYLELLRTSQPEPQAAEAA